MSESILNHGYAPEEHAPDPVIGHGDPTPPGKIAIWLFLASEVMFFIGLLATYIIFRSGSPTIFAEHAAALSKALAGINTLVLIFSSLTMALAVDAAQKGLRGRTIACLSITLLCAFGFMAIKFVEYRDKLTHYTVVTREADGKFYVYDGHLAAKTPDALKLTHAHKMAMPPDGPFNIHWMSAQQVATMEQMQHGAGAPAAAGTSAGTTEATAADDTHGESGHADAHGQDVTIPRSSISQAITYGPWKNIFYACYFATTGVHGLHVVGGIVAIALLLAHAIRGKLLAPHTEYVGLYWHFVDLVWIFLFPLLYLI